MTVSDLHLSRCSLGSIGFEDLQKLTVCQIEAAKVQLGRIDQKSSVSITDRQAFNPVFWLTVRGRRISKTKGTTVP